MHYAFLRGLGEEIQLLNGPMDKTAGEVHAHTHI